MNLGSHAGALIITYTILEFLIEHEHNGPQNPILIKKAPILARASVAELRGLGFDVGLLETCGILL